MSDSKVKVLKTSVLRQVVIRIGNQTWPLMAVVLTGCVVLVVLVFISCRSTTVTEGAIRNNNSKPQTLTFRNTMIVDGKTEDGVRFVDYKYKSSDSGRVSYKTIYFQSLARAKEEIERTARRASVIIARGPLMDLRSSNPGERLILQFYATQEHGAHAEVIWNTKSDYHSIVGSSLEHVSELEKALISQTGRMLSRIDDVQQVTFTTSQVREGKTEHGVYYCEKQFLSSDCETIIVRTEYFASQALAQGEMERKLKESTNIIERGQKINVSGQAVGERAIAMFKREPQSEYIEDTALLWRVNAKLYSIKGPFAHILEFEKRHNKSD